MKATTDVYRGAARLMIHVGTSGYNYPAWRGSFYPERLAAAAMLPFYAERFETVEINASFYRVPTPKTIGGWSAATPAPFVFALKVPQRITHMGRLVNVDEPLQFFARRREGSGPSSGPFCSSCRQPFGRTLVGWRACSRGCRPT